MKIDLMVSPQFGADPSASLVGLLLPATQGRPCLLNRLPAWSNMICM